MTSTDNCSNHIQLVGDQIHLIYAHKRISRRELEFYFKSFSNMDPKLLQEITFTFSTYDLS
jgi:hypothetical protein